MDDHHAVLLVDPKDESIGCNGPATHEEHPPGDSVIARAAIAGGNLTKPTGWLVPMDQAPPQGSENDHHVPGDLAWQAQYGDHPPGPHPKPDSRLAGDQFR